MTESAGIIKTFGEVDDDKIYLGIIIEPVDDTLDTLSQVYEWRIGKSSRQGAKIHEG